jgi:hypothetical protein
MILKLKAGLKVRVVSASGVRYHVSHASRSEIDARLTVMEWRPQRRHSIERPSRIQRVPENYVASTVALAHPAIRAVGLAGMELQNFEERVSLNSDRKWRSNLLPAGRGCRWVSLS